MSVVLLLATACSAPHTTGGLWAQQNLQQELQLFRLSDAQRAEGARAYELTVADDLLAAEQTRLGALLADCPGASGALNVDRQGDRARDGIRIQAQSDVARLKRVATLALADWYLRRAASTGDVRFCDRAGATLDGSEPPAVATADDPFAQPPMATVVRDAARAERAVLEGVPRELALSSYVLGWADTVRAPSPLPQYLAAVYGGTAHADQPIDPRGTPEELVDQLAPLHPDIEPDALFAALAKG